MEDTGRSKTRDTTRIKLMRERRFLRWWNRPRRRAGISLHLGMKRDAYWDAIYTLKSLVDDRGFDRD